MLSGATSAPTSAVQRRIDAIEALGQKPHTSPASRREARVNKDTNILRKLKMWSFPPTEQARSRVGKVVIRMPEEHVVLNNDPLTCSTPRQTALNTTITDGGKFADSTMKLEVRKPEIESRSALSIKARIVKLKGSMNAWTTLPSVTNSASNSLASSPNISSQSQKACSDTWYTPPMTRPSTPEGRTARDATARSSPALSQSSSLVNRIRIHLHSPRVEDAERSTPRGRLDVLRKRPSSIASQRSATPIFRNPFLSASHSTLRETSKTLTDNQSFGFPSDDECSIGLGLALGAHSPESPPSPRSINSTRRFEGRIGEKMFQSSVPVAIPNPIEESPLSVDPDFLQMRFDCENRRRERHTISGVPALSELSLLIPHANVTQKAMKTVATQTTTLGSPFFEILPIPSPLYPRSAFSSYDSSPLEKNQTNPQSCDQIDPTLRSVPLSIISLPRTSISPSIYPASPASALSFLSSLGNRKYNRKYSGAESVDSSAGESLNLDEQSWVKGRHEPLGKLSQRRASSFSIASSDSILFQPYSSDSNTPEDRTICGKEQTNRSHFLVEALRNIPITEEDLETGFYASSCESDY